METLSISTGEALPVGNHPGEIGEALVREYSKTPPMAMAVPGRISPSETVLHPYEDTWAGQRLSHVTRLCSQVEHVRKKPKSQL